MPERVNRLYGDLAWLWPMWGDPATEYRAFSERVAHLFETHARRAVHSVLNISCGAGKNVVNLKERYAVNGYDPAPADDWTEAAMVFFIREHGTLRIEHDLHRTGLFSIETWRRLLAGVGFDVHEGTYREGRREFAQFACVRPD